MKKLHEPANYNSAPEFHDLTISNLAFLKNYNEIANMKKVGERKWVDDSMNWVDHGGGYNITTTESLLSLKSEIIRILPRFELPPFSENYSNKKHSF